MSVQDNIELTEQQLAWLRQEYVRRLPEQLLAVAADWQKLCHTDDCADAVKPLLRVLHSLTGSAATFGCNGVADIARRFESLLKHAAEVGWQSDALFVQQGDSYLSWLHSAAGIEGRSGAAAYPWSSPPHPSAAARQTPSANSDSASISDNDDAAALHPGFKWEKLSQRINERRRHVIGDRRRATRELQQLMFALDQHAIVSMADRGGNIIYANDKFCRISGYARAELIGNNHRIVKGWNAPEIYADLWRTISSGQVWQGTLCNRSKTGGHYWVETTIVPIVDRAGKFLRYISIRTDVTHLQQMRDQLLAAKDEAERANQAKSEFLSRMSHELRTPLNAMLGFAQLLSSDPDEPLSGEQSENVHQIETAGWHLLELINEVLDLSRIEAGRISIHLEAVPFAEVLAECRDLMMPLAIQRGITWHEEIAGAAGKPLWVDRMRFKQVLLNLLSNAVKYNRTAGQVGVSCETVENKLRIAVTDQGPGLTDEQLQHLFEPFNRLNAEHSDVQGTGIGLVITKGLVTTLGGTIAVHSRPGAGSEFSVLLPLAAAKTDPKTPIGKIEDEIVETLLRA